MTVRNHSNTAPVQGLTAAVDADDTELPVAATAAFPAVPFTLVIDRATDDQEVVLCTATTGTSFTVTRGFDGTMAKGHDVNSPIEHTVAALDYREANAHVNAPHVYPSLADAKGDLLVGTAADQVGRLAVGANGFSPVAESSADAGLRWEKSRGTIVCTSTTRPTLGLYEGVRIYETDSKLFYVYIGTGWMPEPGQSLGVSKVLTNGNYAVGITQRMVLNFTMPTLIGGRRVQIIGNGYYITLPAAVNLHVHTYMMLSRTSGLGMGTGYTSAYIANQASVGVVQARAVIDNSDIAAGATTVYLSTMVISGPSTQISHALVTEAQNPVCLDAMII